MAKLAAATFTGKTGSYNFEVYPADTSFNAVGAVYILTKREVGPDGKGRHTFLSLLSKLGFSSWASCGL
jgi:hypothetical protein